MFDFDFDSDFCVIFLSMMDSVLLCLVYCFNSWIGLNLDVDDARMFV